MPSSQLKTPSHSAFLPMHLFLPSTLQTTAHSRHTDSVSSDASSQSGCSSHRDLIGMHFERSKQANWSEEQERGGDDLWTKFEWTVESFEFEFEFEFELTAESSKKRSLRESLNVIVNLHNLHLSYHIANVHTFKSAKFTPSQVGRNHIKLIQSVPNMPMSTK